MPQVTYISQDGSRETYDVESGTTVKDAALDADVEGIVGECGGNLMCATCHVYVDAEWADRLPPRGTEEEELLDEATAPVRATSRLSCQLVMDDGLDGLVVHVPESQT